MTNSEKIYQVRKVCCPKRVFGNMELGQGGIPIKMKPARSGVPQRR